MNEAQIQPAWAPPRSGRKGEELAQGALLGFNPYPNPSSQVARRSWLRARCWAAGEKAARCDWPLARVRVRVSRVSVRVREKAARCDWPGARVRRESEWKGSGIK